MGFPIILLLLYFWRLFAEVRQEMAKSPGHLPKQEPPVVNNTQTNHYHQTVNIVVMPPETPTNPHDSPQNL
jgi:hypothetical protein